MRCFGDAYCRGVLSFRRRNVLNRIAAPAEVVLIKMQEILTFISVLILLWNTTLPGIAQFTGFFIGVGLSSWIVDEFFTND